MSKAFCLPDMSGVLYRTGLENRDYDEAIEAMRDAKKQRGKEGFGCTICHDTGHTAEQCHHNPLVMARRAVQSTRTWRCFHCGEVFTDPVKAEEHFGFSRAGSKPKCFNNRPKKRRMNHVRNNA